MTAPTWEIRGADVLTALREMPDESVHCVVTSPPYWGLRDYGTAAWDGGDPECGHKAPPKHGAIASSTLGRIDGYRDHVPAENSAFVSNEPHYRSVCGRCGARRVDQQLGLEATPAEYIARMVEVFAEVRRVLRSDGTCWVNMGDSYSNDARGSLRPPSAGSIVKDGRFSGVVTHTMNGLKPKDLIGMPWRLAFALQADGWYLRSEIIWHKPNPMPESVQSRPTKAHEQIFLLTKAARYFYDADAIREPMAEASASRYGNGGTRTHTIGMREPTAGRNARSVWTIATQPFPGSHFAVFPEELPRRCILAGSPEGGTVLDPFAGSGTTLLVAVRHGRSAIGIELNPEYAEMARRRILADHGAVEPTNGHTPAEVRGVQGRLAF